MRPTNRDSIDWLNSWTCDLTSSEGEITCQDFIKKKTPTYKSKQKYIETKT